MPLLDYSSVSNRLTADDFTHQGNCDVTRMISCLLTVCEYHIIEEMVWKVIVNNRIIPL